METPQTPVAGRVGNHGEREPVTRRDGLVKRGALQGAQRGGPLQDREPATGQSIPSADTDAAERDAWVRLADACATHDLIAEAFALADLRRLLPPLPEQREATP